MADKPPIDWDNQPQQAASSSKPPIDWDQSGAPPAPEKSMGRQLWDGTADFRNSLGDGVWGTAKGLYDTAEGAGQYLRRSINGEVPLSEQIDRAGTAARGAADFALAPGAMVAKGLGLVPQGADVSKLASKSAAVAGDLVGAGDYNATVKGMNTSDEKYPGARALGEAVPATAAAIATGGFSSIPAMAGTVAAQSALTQQADKGSFSPRQAIQDSLIGTGIGGVTEGLRFATQSVKPLAQAAKAGVQEWTAGSSLDNLQDAMKKNQSPNVQQAGQTVEHLQSPAGAAEKSAIVQGGESHYSDALSKAQTAVKAFDDLDSRLSKQFSDASGQHEQGLLATKGKAANALDEQFDLDNSSRAHNLSQQANAYQSAVMEQRAQLGQARQEIYRGFNDPLPSKVAKIMDLQDTLNTKLQEMELNDQGRLAQTIKGQIQNRLRSLYAEDTLDPITGKPATRDVVPTAGQALQGLTEINSTLGKIYGETGDYGVRQMRTLVNGYIDHIESHVAPQYGAEVDNTLSQVRRAYNQSYDAGDALQDLTMQRGKVFNSHGKLVDGHTSEPSKVVGQVRNSIGADNSIHAIERVGDAVPGSTDLASSLRDVRSRAADVSPGDAMRKLTPTEQANLPRNVRRANPDLGWQMDYTDTVKQSDPFQRAPLSNQDQLLRGQSVTQHADLPGVPESANADIGQALKFQPTQDKLNAVRSGQKEFTSTLGADPMDNPLAKVIPGVRGAKSVADALGLGMTREDAVSLLRQKAEAGQTKANAFQQLKDVYRGKPVGDAVQTIVTKTGRPLTDVVVDKLSRLYSVDPIQFRRTLISLGLALDGQ